MSSESLYMTVSPTSTASGRPTAASPTSLMIFSFARSSTRSTLILGGRVPRPREQLGHDGVRRRPFHLELRGGVARQRVARRAEGVAPRGRVAPGRRISADLSRAPSRERRRLRQPAERRRSHRCAAPNDGARRRPLSRSAPPARRRVLLPRFGIEAPRLTVGLGRRARLPQLPRRRAAPRASVCADTRGRSGSRSPRTAGRAGPRAASSSR